MKNILAVLFFIPFIAFAQKDTVLSGSYNWLQPAMQKNKISSVVLSEGKVHDFEWMQLAANTLSGKKKIKQTIPKNYEALIIVKSGTLIISFGDSSYVLTANSVAVLMPGQKYSVSNSATAATNFYTIKYRKPKDDAQKQIPNSSFVKMWNNIVFKPNAVGGGRRDFFEQPTALQKRFEMHVTTLKEGRQSHEPHTHRAEEIVLVIEGDTEMQIGEKKYSVTPGGFYYLGSNVLHAVKTTGTKPGTYFAIQFE